MYSFSKSLSLSVVTSLNERPDFFSSSSMIGFQMAYSFCCWNWGVIPNTYSCGTRSAASAKLLHVKQCSKIHADTIRTSFTKTP